jgi:hypothetical protein
MKVSYDSRFVPAHDKASQAPVFLMNEAPGPDEAASGIPLFGQQGANLFHALRNAGITWAVNHQKFTWPKNGADRQDLRHIQKREFLVTRAKYFTCTNAYPYWPKPHDNSTKFCPPLKSDVLSEKNIERIRSEVSQNHTAILICGGFAHITCTGEELSNPSQREFSELTQNEIQITNTRFNSNLQKGWYMGHTRRWSMNQQKAICTLKKLAKFMNWPLS